MLRICVCKEGHLQTELLLYVYTSVLRTRVCTGGGSCADRVVICVGECAENPCLYSGTCTDGVVVIYVYECVENPCLYEGTCADRVVICVENPCT